MCGAEWIGGCPTGCDEYPNYDEDVGLEAVRNIEELDNDNEDQAIRDNVNIAVELARTVELRRALREAEARVEQEEREEREAMERYASDPEIQDLKAIYDTVWESFKVHEEEVVTKLRKRHLEEQSDFASMLDNLREEVSQKVGIAIALLCRDTCTKYIVPTSLLSYIRLLLL